MNFGILCRPPVNLWRPQVPMSGKNLFSDFELVGGGKRENVAIWREFDDKIVGEDVGSISVRFRTLVVLISQTLCFGRCSSPPCDTKRQKYSVHAPVDWADFEPWSGSRCTCSFLSSPFSSLFSVSKIKSLSEF